MEQLSPLLIVEDSDEDFEVICWALQKTGFTRPILRAERAETALSVLLPNLTQTHWTDPLPCLVLMDLNLPGMTGLQLQKVSTVISGTFLFGNRVKPCICKCISV